MATCAAFQVQMASIMEVLTKTALAEITKLVDDASAELRLEMCRRHKENEALKSKLLVMERELRAARGCGEGTPGSSLNIAFEVKVCDEFKEAQNSKVGGEGSVVAFDERLSTGPVKDEQYVGLPVEKKKTVPHALDIKYEPVDEEQDWSESVLLSVDWLEEDPKTSQSQLEQKISEEDACGTSVAAAANGGQGPLCEEEEEELHMQPCPAGDAEKGLRAALKQEPDEEPLTPGHLLPGSAEGLEVQCVTRKASKSGKVWEMLQYHRGGSEHGGAWSNDRFSPRHFRASQRLCSEKNEGPTSHLEQQQNGRLHELPYGILTEMAFPLSSRGERMGSTPTSVHTGEKPHSCNKCGKSFAQLGNLKTHQRVHTGEKPHSCNECGKSFAQLVNLKSHQMVHTREEPHNCTKCGKSFSYLCYLKNHQCIHTGEKPHSCNECGKSFAQLGHLRTHQRVHTREKPHSCNKCGKSFVNLQDLKRHQRVHTGEKPHSCNESGQSFAQLGHLKTQQSVHAGEKPHSCDECGKSFAYLCHLKSHQRVHTGEKPHSCNKCGKSFANLQVLKCHQRIHTGEKPHSCNECGKSFAKLCDLKTHQRVHTGEKPHSCDECGKSFAQLGNLKTHQRVHTGEKPYGCMLCAKSFSQKHVLQKHILTHS